MIINPSPTLTNLGGKGYHLSLLKEFCLVPEYFVICFENDVEINMNETKDEILRAFDSSGYEYVSVRSSATVEDSNLASFAGMFRTKLNVARFNLLDSITDVISSMKEERLIAYSNVFGIKASEIQMRVVIQRMVNSSIAGVCFTKDSGNPNNMLIEACLGVGEVLVNGTSVPDTYTVNRQSLEINTVSIGYQKEMIVTFHPNEIRSIPFHLRNSKKLRDSQLLELAKTSLKIEKNMNYQAVDIEWAFDKDKLYILQARPLLCMSQ